MAVHSAALLLHRRGPGGVQGVLRHLGGAVWGRQDAREGAVAHLGDFRQRSGKVLVVHEARAEAPVEFVASNEFTIEWPPGSGTPRSYPEIDRARWFGVSEARDKVVKGQVAVLDALAARLGG